LFAADSEFGSSHADELEHCGGMRGNLVSMVKRGEVSENQRAASGAEDAILVQPNGSNNGLERWNGK
jgi:hypothetical protein